MPSKKIRTPIEPGSTYHIFNRGNNYQDVFFSKYDYQLFMNLMEKHLSDYCTIYAFALLPNHYHLLLRVNDDLEGQLFSRKFANFILSYTNKINFREKRIGNLFLSYFRRVKVEKEDYIKRLIFYINFNPVKHKISDNPESYEFCSYQLLLSERYTTLNREEVFGFFGGRTEFLEYHNYSKESEPINKLTLED